MTLKNISALLGGNISANLVIQSRNIPDFIRYSKLMRKINVGCGYEMCGGFEGDLKKEAVNKLKKIIDIYLAGKLGPIREFEDKMPFFKAISSGEIRQESLEKGTFSTDLFRKQPVNCLRCIDYSIVDSKGNVFPCCYYSQIVKPMGNIKEKKFFDIWCSKLYNEFRKKVTPVDMSKKDIETTCEACDNYFKFKEINDKLKG
jgi:radical SAM protein with 4Fe4S-binding SPASM domain